MPKGKGQRTNIMALTSGVKKGRASHKTLQEGRGQFDCGPFLIPHTLLNDRKEWFNGQF
jgi:hypothetical protein